MATTTLRPNGTVSAAPSRTGATTDHAALSDDLDGSYVSRPQGGVELFGEWSFPDTVISGQIKSVSFRLRYKGTTVEANEPLLVYLVSPTGQSYSGRIPGKQGSITTYQGISFATRPDGASWTQADIDAMTWRMVRDNVSGVSDFGHTAYELYIDVISNAAPTVTVTSPTGTITSTSRPPVVHTYSDPEGDAQERKRVKVFSAAQYGAGGFNPETSTATWDSGEVFSSTTSTTPGVDLANSTTYKGYAKAADAGSGGRYSAWAAGPTFTMDLGPVIPPVPTLSAVAEAGRIALTARSTGTPNVEFMRFEYLDGADWVTARGGERVPASSGVDVVLYDYEATSGVSRSYRATAGRVNLGNDVFSAPSSTAAAIPAAITAARIFDPLDPSAPVVLTLQPASDQEIEVISMQGRSGVFKALGREDLVTVSDVMDSDEWPFIAIVAAVDWPALRALIRSQRVLLLQEPGQQRYCRLGDDVTVSELASPGAERRVRATARGKPRP